MLLKIVTIFLIVIAVLGMFGALRIGRGRGRRTPRRVERADARPKDVPGTPRKCAECGSWIVGRGGCACGAK